MIAEKEIREALKDVKDPELGYNIVDLGLIYEVLTDKIGDVTIVYSLTSPACPEGATIEKNMRDRLRLIEGIKEIKTELTFTPAWSVEKMSEELRAEFGLLGI
ncbi:MAG: metal-sulfur cluster assembly factor [bacterium]|nr:metal-sulfur cluster assembly factor [bacterium]